MNEYSIRLNATGTHYLPITAAHLHTLKQHQLFRDLVDSHGYVDEAVLHKLRLMIQALLLGQQAQDTALMDLWTQVIQYPKMKAYGLYQLVLLYVAYWGEKEDGYTPNMPI